MEKPILRELKPRDPNTEHLPLPCGEMMKARYRRLQNELDKRKLEPLHQLSRERLGELLDEVEARLGLGPGAA